MAVKQVFNTSAELDFPNVLPTLDLDFANSKTLDPRITFTRSSGGSYVGADGLIKYAGVNEARFDHDPISGESLGLLVEEARTNLTTQSENFSDAAWTKTRATINENVIVSPDGNQTADEILCNLTGGFNGRVTRSISIGNNYYTISFHAKKGNTDWLMITIEMGGAGGRRCWYNLSTGKIGGNISAFGGVWDFETKMEDVGNGWYRCSITVNVTTGSGTLSYYAMCPNNNLNANSNSGNSIYIWGAQLEVGAFPTSYIPTQASTRTRAADNAQITGKNFSEWYRQDEGTIYSSFKFIDNTRDTDINGFGKAILNFIDNSQTERIRFATSALGNSISTIWISNSITQATLNSGPYDKNKEISVSSSYKTNNFALSRNNSQQTLKSSVGKVPININTLHIGRSTSAFGYISGTIRRITYYPKALSPSNLQSLTS
jgi:hypothetical protein